MTDQELLETLDHPPTLAEFPRRFQSVERCVRPVTETPGTAFCQERRYALLLALEATRAHKVSH